MQKQELDSIDDPYVLLLVKPCCVSWCGGYPQVFFGGMTPVPLRYSAAGQAGAGHYGHLGVTLGPINNLERQQLLKAACGLLGGYCAILPFPSISHGDLQPLGP